MPQIKPLRAFRYNTAVVQSYDKVLAPPYDVISPEEQAALYGKSPYNFVRIDLRKKQQGETDEQYYQAAAGQLNDWVQKNVFIQEDKPAIYVYLQDYKNLEGKKVTRLGFLSLMKINPRLVKKHEHTLSGPKKDRTALMEAMQTQLSPIMGIIDEKAGIVQKNLALSAKQKPLIDVTLADVRHRIIVETDEKRIAAISKAVEKKNMYIADGHHRFAVTDAFRKVHKRWKGTQYILTYFCDAGRNDFIIYPTHRVLTSLDEGWEEILAKQITSHFDAKPFANWKALEKSLEAQKKGRSAVGVLYHGKFVQLTLKKKTRDLDTTVLQKYLVSRLIKTEVAKSDQIYFTREAEKAIGDVKSKKSQLAFFLSKMPVSEMMRVSDEGVKLPQKSTYFYPKLLSGIVLYRFV